MRCEIEELQDEIARLEALLKPAASQETPKTWSRLLPWDQNR